MARLPRLAVAGLPHYLIQRGHSGQAVFADGADRDSYIAALRAACLAYGVSLHAYAVLPNEVHLLVTPGVAAALGRMVQAVGRRHAAGFNRRHGRQGSLWDGRFHAAVIDPDEWVLTCMCHVESLPLRAGIVVDLADWPWSSHAHHVGVAADACITDPPPYWALGNTPFEREAAYRRRFVDGVGATQAQRLHESAMKGWALGAPDFLAALAAQTERRLVPGRRGRPRKRLEPPDRSVPDA